MLLLITCCGGTIGSIDTYVLNTCNYEEAQRKIKISSSREFKCNSLDFQDTCINRSGTCVYLCVNNPDSIIFTCNLNKIEKMNKCYMVFTHVRKGSQKSKIDRELNLYEKYKYKKLIRDSIINILNDKYKLGVSDD